MKQNFILIGVFSVMLLAASCGNSNPEGEKAAWETALKTNTVEALDSFLQAYPETGHKAEIAKMRDGMLWETAVLENTIYHYKKYLGEFPEGKHKTEAENKLDSMPSDEVSLADLTAKTFVGTIHQGDKDYDVLALKFMQIESNDNGISFAASVHLSSDIRKQLNGSIVKPDYTISFEENKEDDVLLNLSDGRLYIRDGGILIQSVDPNQYWQLK